MHNGVEEMDWEDVDGEIQDIPNAHFDVLHSSLPGYMTRRSSAMGLVSDLDSCHRIHQYNRWHPFRLARRG